jgi:hypothetical protein
VVGASPGRQANAGSIPVPLRHTNP